MTFDLKITWKTHIEELKTRYESSINMLRMVEHRSWEINKKKKPKAPV